MICEKKANNNGEHREVDSEQVKFVISIILFFVYVALLLWGVGIRSCTCLVVAFVLNTVKTST